MIPSGDASSTAPSRSSLYSRGLVEHDEPDRRVVNAHRKHEPLPQVDPDRMIGAVYRVKRTALGNDAVIDRAEDAPISLFHSRTRIPDMSMPDSSTMARP